MKNKKQNNKKMNTYFELKKLIEELEEDVTKVYTKQNKAAAVRVRINENRKQWG